MNYLHGHFLDKVSLVRVIKGDAVVRIPVYNQLPQHGALLSDIFGQTAGVDTWNEEKPLETSFTCNITKAKQLKLSYLNAQS